MKNMRNTVTHTPPKDNDIFPYYTITM